MLFMDIRVMSGLGNMDGIGIVVTMTIGIVVVCPGFPAGKLIRAAVR